MNALLQSLQGKKTHATCVALIGLLIAHWKGWLVLPTEVYGVMVGLALMFLRQGISREINLISDPAPDATPTGAGASTAPTPQGKTGTFSALLMAAGLGLLLVLSFGPGCASTLELGGAYAPAITNASGQVTAVAAADMTLFQIDSGFELAYTALETAFKLERDNRAMLWKVSPDIKHGLDAIRPSAAAIKKKFAFARTAYRAVPTPENLTGLQGVLAEVERISAAATAALPTATK